MNRIIFFLIMIVTFSYGCSRKCSIQPANEFNIVYFVNNSKFSDQGINIGDEISDVIKVFKKLNKNLNTKHNFYLKQVIDVRTDDLDAIKNLVERGDFKKTINVFIPSAYDQDDYPFHDKLTSFIKIPFINKNNATILMHEVFHRIVKDNVHVGNNHNVNGCVLEKSNGCLNLMSTFQLTTFNFLITESQSNWVNNLCLDDKCTSIHVYPEDLIESGFESTFECCDNKIIVNKVNFERLLGKSLTLQEYKNLEKTINDLQANNLCPINLEEKEIETASRTLTTFRDTTDSRSFDPVPSDNIDYSSSINNDTLKLEINQASIIYKKAYIENIRELLQEEAEYLTNGTGVSAIEYANSRFQEMSIWVLQELGEPIFINVLK